ncbi:hypothetical protein NFI96_026829 [Prochilodus magdalenae]|nr:hypothetical protein NFI96_026829 [Prochilodus magdalenae]
MMLLCVMLMIFTGFTPTTSENFKVVGPAAALVAEDEQEELVLPCSLHPNISAVAMMVEWIRTDLTEINKLVHLYEDHKDRNYDQMESYKGRTALFKYELQKGNTSLKLSAIRPSDEGAYKCFVQFGSVRDDAFIYVEVEEKAFHTWKIVIICFSVFIIGIIAFVAYILKEKKLSPAQCSVIAYMRLHSENVRNEWDLKKYHTSAEGYRRLIPAITNCRKARLVGCNLTTQSIDTLQSVLQTENSFLKHLDLSYNGQQNLLEKFFTGLKNSHCRLESLRLVGCNLTTQSIDALRSILHTENSSLKDLDLSYNGQQDLLERLFTGPKNSHCTLETLRLITCNLTAQSIDTLQSVLQTEHSSLKDLDLSYNGQQDLLEKFFTELKNSHCRLETLRLVGCNLTAQLIDTLQSVLQTENSSLKHLDLSNNGLQDSLESLSAGLKNSHCRLETLRLVGCNLTAQSIDPLQSVLQIENSSMKELDIGNNDLEDSGVELLTTGLKSKHCALEILRLSRCMITEKGCSFLASALSSNSSHLKELDLTYNHPGESGVKLLSARLKDPQYALSTLRLEHGGEDRIKPGLKKYSCEVTLNPNTAHSRLSLSDGNRKVGNVRRDEPYPDHPERFDGTLDMLDRYREQQATIAAALTSPEIRQNAQTINTPDSSDFRDAEDLVKLLYPLKTATTVLWEEESPTASLIVPLKNMIEQSMTPDEGDSTTVGDLSTISGRYSGDAYTFLLECTTLDPWIKQLKQKQCTFSVPAEILSHAVLRRILFGSINPL